MLRPVGGELSDVGSTIDDYEEGRADRGPPRPGAVLIFSASSVEQKILGLERGAIELGRELFPRDERLSRKHARLAFDGARWLIQDLGSKNGTFVDGARIDGEVAFDAPPKCVRIGGSILICEREVRTVEEPVEVKEGIVVGPRLRESHRAIQRAARYQDTLFIRGESGSGKELAARVFHETRGRATDPFLAVNCATIPEGVAERLLFGARKGAYSGAAADADGYLIAASGGTLFLDEIAELDLPVQAKLLRALETKEVLALGDSTPRKIQLRVCSATHRDLRQWVAAGKFREDLYFRIGRPEIVVPPIRERPEEIPWHVVREVEAIDAQLSVHVGLIEACLLRDWPGNVRELRAEVRHAAQEAVAASRAQIEASDLAKDAGSRFSTRSGAASKAGSSASRPASPSESVRADPPDRAEIEDALRSEKGNVTRAAKRLRIHRNQLRRWLEKNAVDPTLFGHE
jgi:transcriptional regulator with PAS, ATPase and Fis domain